MWLDLQSAYELTHVQNLPYIRELTLTESMTSTPMREFVGVVLSSEN